MRYLSMTLGLVLLAGYPAMAARQNVVTVYPMDGLSWETGIATVKDRARFIRPVFGRLKRNRVIVNLSQFGGAEKTSLFIGRSAVKALRALAEPTLVINVHCIRLGSLTSSGLYLLYRDKLIRVDQLARILELQSATPQMLLHVLTEVTPDCIRHLAFAAGFR